MLESPNVDQMKSNCSWDMFLWKNPGRLHSFMSFSKIFQLCTHARITKCVTHERSLFVRHVFVNEFRRTSQFHEFFKNISTLYPCYNHEMWITWKVIVRETWFFESIQADYTVSWVFQKYFNFVPLVESRNVHHVKGNCSWDMFLWKNSGGRHSFMNFSKIFQFCTDARITKCGSREKWLFVRHDFVKKFRWTAHFHEFFRNISTLYPC